MITSFLVIFFFCGWYFFFWPKAKKKTQLSKKNTHQQTKLLIQRKHLYAYDMKFLCQPILVFFWGYQNIFEMLGFCSEPTIKEISKMSALSVLRHKKLKFQWYLPLSIENKEYSDYHMTFKSQAPFEHFQGLHNSYI